MEKFIESYSDFVKNSINEKYTNNKIYFVSLIKTFSPKKWEYCFVNKEDAEEYALINQGYIYPITMEGNLFETTLDGRDDDYKEQIEVLEYDSHDGTEFKYIRVNNLIQFNFKPMILAFDIDYI